MKRILNNSYILTAACAICLGIASCTKGFEDLNKSPDKPDAQSLSIPGLFNGIAKNVADVGFNENTLFVALLYDQANQQAVQGVDAPVVNYSSGLWSTYYPILLNYKKLTALINANPGKENYSNVKYMADILMASKTLRMLDCYGDIPYSAAGQSTSGSDYFRPTYDAQSDVYKSVMADLKAAANGIKTNDATQISISNYDSFLGNDYQAWIRFANALRLRYAVRLYNKEQALATETITEILGGNKPLPGNQDLAALSKNNFGLWPSNLNPKIVFGDRIWYSFREGSVTKMRMSSNVWDQMSANNNTDGSGIFDPRCRIWFMTNNADKWVPQPQNHSSPDGGQPYPGSKTRPAIGTDAANLYAAFNIQLVSDETTYPYIIISEADVYFLKAEIYQRGMGVAKDIAAAKAAYEAGIKSSVNFWYAYTGLAPWGNRPVQPSPADLTAFLNNSKVAYNGANDADALKKIATQAWLATMWEPVEAWSIVRRTGLTPKDPTYTPAKPQVYKLPYPDDERINNYANWTKAINGVTSPDDQLKTKVYWMP
ncbi:MAG: SusD/RagB family nutrient-binding outer membrane lipoprotein [Niabella sp.]|nr:SusD/RagB family nutrient-binding outer membrane lipoprotein [Niabella sp.]